MSSDQENEQDISESRSREMERIHMAWKAMKDGKRGSERLSDKKSLLSVKDAIHHEEQKNLEARLSMTQNQLAKARENTALLMKKLSQAQQEIEVLRQQLEEQRRNLQEKDMQLEELTNHITNLQSEEHVYYQQQSTKHNTFGPQAPQTNPHNNQQSTKDAKRIAQLEERLDDLREQLDHKTRDLEKVGLKYKSGDLELQKLGLQNQKLLDENELLRKRIEQAQHSLNDAILQQQSKGAQLLQIDELNRTIQRLLQLLKSTQEYKEFALFAEDSQTIHFLKNIPKRLKTNSVSMGSNKIVKSCTCMEVKIDERLIWTPSQAYKFMLEMKMKYDSLTQQCIEQVLYGLNRLCLSRQQNHVKRVRQAYDSELNRLKKKTDERYDQMIARKQIERLKRDLSKARSKEPPVTLNTLKAAGQYEDQIRLKDKEIRLLHERLKLIESELGGYDKAVYMEGALWVLGKVIQEVENARQNLGEFEQYFVESLESILGEEAKSTRLMRAYKAFFQNIEEVMARVYQRVLMMEESTRRKLAAQKGQKTRNENGTHNS